MPSPFPGMDPYLERPACWPDIHLSLIVLLRAQLNAQLPTEFLANIETAPRENSAETPPHRFIQISQVSDPARIVTVIEVLSPANKAFGRGFEDYREKQETLLDAPVNLLEIDLLRTGRETVALPHRQDIPQTPYIVTLHCAGDGNDFDTYQPARTAAPRRRSSHPGVPRPDIGNSGGIYSGI